MALINKPKPQAQAQQSELKPFRAYPCEASCKSKANGLIYFVCKNKMFDDKLVKTLNNSATLTGLAAGIG